MYWLSSGMTSAEAFATSTTAGGISGGAPSRVEQPAVTASVKARSFKRFRAIRRT
jgi:hypothetical protein